MRSLTLVFTLLIPAVAASAAVPTDPHPSTLSTQSRHAQWVRVNFYNSSVQGRMLTIGENSYLVPPGKTVSLQVTAGSNVQLSSPWNSKVNGQVLQVRPADAYRTVTLQ